mmetsp:Transcript_34235/g.69038  ORF Transcript_34235/g.69038 Transcript_34235/m.69038 type:complete len:542 (+) Transcript_34235:165-1790(+)
MPGPIALSRRLSSSAAAATIQYAAKEATKAGAPASALSIPATVRYGPTSLRTPQTPADHETAGAVIRQVGCSRRVFLLRPHLTSQELSGLAYRIAVMGKNEGINSVLIATNDDDDAANLAFPTSTVDSERKHIPPVDIGEKTGYGRIFHVAGGYDARAVYSSGMHERPEELSSLLDGVRDLALATRGEVGRSDDDKDVTERFRVPVITMPHGMVNDGGYALCMGSYVLATRDTCYRTLNPYRGLAFDPVGLSYVLPRLGDDFNQPARKYPVGMVLALTSYEADAHDMIETGLATHYVEAQSKLGAIENSLAEIVPWNQQGLLTPPPRQYGQFEGIKAAQAKDFDPEDDINNRLRNVAVANLLHSVSVYDAAGQEEASPALEQKLLPRDDPSLILERERFFEERGSVLVSVGATFDDIFKSKDVSDIIEGLREVASAEPQDKEEKECCEIAATLLEDMQSQSPLALRAVHRLMELGGKDRRSQSLESCIEREKIVQMNLLRGEDFKRWAESGAEEGEFTDWKHKTVKDVTNDEVEALFQGTS